MRSFFLLIILLFLSQLVFPQTDSVLYTKDFVFNDGIYITLEDFKNNAPPLTPENFKKYNPGTDYLDGNLFKGELLGHRKINYPDSSGNIISFLTDSLFGFCIKNEIFLYERLNEFDIFYKVFRLGKVSLMFELKGGKGPGIMPLLILGSGGVGVGAGIIPSNASANKDDQYLFSFDTGNYYKYNLKYFSFLLDKKDKELFNEFSKLSKGKQKEMMFIYLNKLNERNPVYFKAVK